jgi:hypothetical protein
VKNEIAYGGYRRRELWASRDVEDMLVLEVLSISSIQHHQMMMYQFGSLLSSTSDDRLECA